LVGVELDDMSREDQIQVLVDNLKWAAPQLEDAGLLLMVEALNPFDNPGYLLTRTKEVVDVLKQVGSSAIMCQYDVYHAQRLEGDLVNTIRTYIDWIGHVQVADNPGRHQPGTGEINYRFLLQALDDAGYEGYIGLEYAPEPNTEASLCWLPADKRVESTAADLVL
jgi:hydroxypyruvate isomerase